MALALYRRYRPDAFEGVIGQDQVTVPLMRALDEGKLTHAYLFSGPRGCGKTSSARILARCVNCAQGPTSHPCGECESCKDLATGGPGSIDVVEIDAASHNGVDDARELRERAGFAPARDRYKIFILDEAHMVTQQGFNALLKIVEEPPEHVMFIFATTEPDKVIGTIRSRTHHYPFRLVPTEVMGPYLEQICEKEGIAAEPGVLKLAMRAGGGSMRDTLSVLDQLMVGAVDGVITHDASVALLGFTPEALIGEAVDAVIDRDGEALYGVIQRVVVGGFDPRRFVEDLLARVRDLLVLTLAGDRAESVLSDSAEGENMDDLHRQAKALGLGSLTVMADTINATLGSMTGAISPRMRLELLAARLLATREGALMPQSMASGTPVGVGGNAANAGGGAAGNGASAASGARFAGAAQQAQPVERAGLAGNGGGFAGRGAGASTPSAVTTPSQSGGEARNDRSEHTDGFAQSTQASKAQNSSDNNGFAAEPGAAEQAGSPDSSASHPNDGVAQDAQTTDSRTPDEKWDALVAGLPEDVRAYVDRTKVPRVRLAPNPANGRMQLWIKFDVPLSKYAFAMGVASEPVEGSAKVQDILRAEVRKMFGPDVALAPTKKMANDEIAPPLSKLPPEEQQKIKARLLQANLGAASSLAQQSGDVAGKTSGSDAPAAGAEKSAGETATDDDEVHRAPSADDDPWAQPAPVIPSGASAAPVARNHADGQTARATRNASVDDDPWAQPAPIATRATPSNPNDDPWAQPVRSAATASNVSRDVSQDDAEPDGWGVPQSVKQPVEQSMPSASPHRKTAAVPDLSDDDDPWKAVPPPSEPPASDMDGEPSGGPAYGQPAAQRQGFAQHQRPRNADPRAAAPQSNDPWNNPQSMAFAQSDERPQPQVAAEDDEYSMSDESLGEATAMSLDDLRKLFEVKKVEEFAADDPSNPRNVKHNKKQSGN
ncbi:DNA polymerase III subunit gamma/tau [Bifidobacterium lemurum]|uniref:DNA-directed DNA polymerase n=1 Tax=Bifidobacterium lemurum TaxID=1603886 RepID=A0A261FTH0_9BIFI|nr:DNA polymerase III subunit gamma and tau [Bifidobacterium lemurum]OZG62066.1 DNA polymerase III subunit gamma/tau [Bifidobacterium lemurum]QOL34895.1 DNA polymerase III subunit gamma and tau [Bifidobacterium lemurum]